MYEKIIETFDKITNLEFTLSLLHWDQSTYMPTNGIDSRAEAMETLTRMLHGIITDDVFYGDLCNAVEGGIKDESRLNEVKRIKENIERARKIPEELAAEMAKTTSLGMNLWEKAKKTNDDTEYLPVLKKIFDLNKETASCMGYEKNPYDALLDEYDRGLKFELIKPLFESLEKELVLIMEKIEGSEVKIRDAFLYEDYDTTKQRDFGLYIAGKMGIDFNGFRQDISAHPFTTRIGLNDIRITTDITAGNFKKGFFSTIHESGHALYEMGVSRKLGRSVFGGLLSTSLHESQSRLYENIIGRGLNFWKKFYAKLHEIFPENLEEVTLAEFYNAINKIEKNPVRIESDELTYNLHILLRTHLENEIINGNIGVYSINEAWNEKTKEILGFYPASKSQGYLQDIHWSSGLVGYFPTYTLGNLIASQIYSFMKKDINLEVIDEDALNKIHVWLDEKLYRLGSIHSPFDKINKITGTELDSGYFISYLKEKFFSIYR